MAFVDAHVTVVADVPLMALVDTHLVRARSLTRLHMFSIINSLFCFL